MKEFNVIIEDNGKFRPYNIIPYLVKRYNEKEDKPSTFEEFKKFVKAEAQYQWWARCEYEIILSPWPYTLSPSERAKEENNVEAWKEHWKKHLNECQKIDVHYQVMMNLDVITNLVMESI
jgi:hypothetical protein